jgi:hypothetical protein
LTLLEQRMQLQEERMARMENNGASTQSHWNRQKVTPNYRNSRPLSIKLPRGLVWVSICCVAFLFFLGLTTYIFSCVSSFFFFSKCNKGTFYLFFFFRFVFGKKLLKIKSQITISFELRRLARHHLASPTLAFRSSFECVQSLTSYSRGNSDSVRVNQAIMKRDDAQHASLHRSQTLTRKLNVLT